MSSIPEPRDLIRNYPLGDSNEVKARIGGKVNAPWITNTCAIRLSEAFNKSGTKIPQNYAGLSVVSGKPTRNPATGKSNPPDWYAYRVAEFQKFAIAKYGQPTFKVRGTGSTTPPPQFAGKPGIICFVDCGWTDASGHLDLWDGMKVVNH